MCGCIPFKESHIALFTHMLCYCPVVVFMIFRDVFYQTTASVMVMINSYIFFFLLVFDKQDFTTRMKWDARNCGAVGEAIFLNSLIRMSGGLPTFWKIRSSLLALTMSPGGFVRWISSFVVYFYVSGIPVDIHERKKDQGNEAVVHRCGQVLGDIALKERGWGEGASLACRKSEGRITKVKGDWCQECSTVKTSTNSLRFCCLVTR